MSEKKYKREAVELLFKHLPPLALALNNLTQVINENIEAIDDDNIKLNIQQDDAKFYQEIIENITQALSGLESLVDEISVKIQEFKSDREAIKFFLEFQLQVIKPNLSGISMLLTWLTDQSSEIELKEIINTLFIGSNNLGKFVGDLTSTE